MSANGEIIMNNELNMFGLWERLWPSIRDYLGICLERLEETIKHLRIVGAPVKH
jgi:hypothetical protein